MHTFYVPNLEGNAQHIVLSEDQSASIEDIESTADVAMNLTIDPDGCANGSCTSGGLTVTQINVNGATSLEGVSVDKNDPNTVLVTSAGFNSTGKVFRVEGATTGSPTVSTAS